MSTFLAVLLSVAMVANTVPTAAWAEIMDEAAATAVVTDPEADPEEAVPEAGSESEPEQAPEAEPAPEPEAVVESDDGYVADDQVVPADEGEDAVSAPAEDDAANEAAVEEEAPATKDVYEYKDDDVFVKATLDDPAAIPDDAELVVTQVTPKTEGYSYDAYMQALNDDAGKEDKYTEHNTMLYDVAFLWVDEEGNTVELQPAEGSVKVEISFKHNQLVEDLDARKASDVEVTHLPLVEEAKAETTADSTTATADDVVVEKVADKDLEAEGDSQLTVTTDGLSVFAVSYTVDFTLDGLTFSIAGESEVKLSEVFARLGLDENAAKAVKVEFTDQALLAVEQLEDASDWKLTSLKPFQSEEKLTVTMGSGKVIEIQVTDAQGDGYSLTLNIVDKNESTPIQPGTGDAPTISDNLFARVYLTGSDGYIAAWGVAPLAADGQTQQVYVNEFHKVTHEVTTDDDGNEVVTYSDTSDEPITFADAVAAGYTVARKADVRVAHGDTTPTSYETANALDISDPDGYTFASHDISGDPYDASVVTIHVTYDTAYFVRVVTEDGGAVAIPDSPYIYAWVTVKHSSGRDTIAAVRLTSGNTLDGGKTYNLPITNWYFTDGTQVANETISGHEVEVSVKLYTAMQEITRVDDALISSGTIKPIAVGNSVGEYVVKSYPVVPSDYVESGDDPMRHIEDDDTHRLRDIFDIVYLEKEADELPTYTLEYILNGYNAVTLCPNDKSKTHTYKGATYTDGDVYLKTHMMGGVLVRGDLIAGGGSGIADSAYANKPSFINGTVPTFNQNSFGGANTRGAQPSGNVSNLYIGDDNTVYGNVVNGVDSGSVGYNHNGNTLINDTFVNWDKLNQVVKSTSASMAELPGTTITVNSEWETIRLDAGQVYYLNNPNNIVHVKIELINYNPAEGATATIINDLSSGGVTVPQVVSINGESIGFYEDKPEGVSIVFNYPNATTVDVRNDLSPEAGHVVAPNADMHIDNCNYNGCMVVNSLYSEGEGHLWPYKGDTLIPASFGFQLTKKVNGEEPTSSQVYTFMLQKWTGSGWAAKPTPADKNTYQEKNNDGSAINFDEITWTETGRYFYLISEKATDDEYTFTDGTKFIVQVDVTSEHQGSSIVFTGEETYYKVDSSVEDLSSLIREDAVVVGNKVVELHNGESDAQFINKVVGNLKITKKVDPAPTTDEGKNAEFTFEVALTNTNEGVTLAGQYDAEKTAADGTKTQTTVTVGEDGKVTDIKLKHGESLEIKGLPAGTTYKVTETPAEGYKQKSKTDDEGTIEAGKTAEASFVNEVNKGSLKITKKVTVAGQAVTDNTPANLKNLADGTYKFEIYQGETATGTPIKNVELTITDGASSTKLVGDLTPGKYTIKEVSGGTGKATLTNPATGTITVTVEPGKTGNDIVVAEFTNGYDAKGTATVQVAKHLTGRALTADEFSFTISAVNGAPLKDADGNDIAAAKLTKTNAADGTVVFETLNFTLDDAGKPYVYKIVENSITDTTVSRDTENGPEEIYAKVTVGNDKGDGTLADATVEYYKDAECTEELTEAAFVNKYDATGTTSLTANKTFAHKNWPSGTESFSFTVTATGDNASKAPTFAGGSATKTTPTAQLGTINYTLDNLDKNPDGTPKKTTYTYEVAEVIPEGAVNNVKDGVTYTTTKIVTLELEDDGQGHINAVVKVDGQVVTGENNVFSVGDFENDYAAKGEGEIKVKKTLVGRDWTTDDSFKFTLTANNGAPMPKDNDGNEVSSVTITSEDAEDYTKTFGKIAFTAEGEYTYTIVEAHHGETIKGVAYDSAESMTITIKVKDNGKGELVADGTELIQTAEFTNIYSAEGGVGFEAHKDLSGRDLSDAKPFTFTLTDVTKPSNPVLKETVTAGSDGKVTFADVAYKLDDLGEHIYEIREVIPDEAKNADLQTYAAVKAAGGDLTGNWTLGAYTYDGHVARVMVTVTDNGDGTLKAEKTVVTGEGTLSFKNKYEAGTSVQFEATKQFSGKKLEEEAFSFTLTGDGNVSQTKTNDDTGKVTFDEITYGIEDLKGADGKYAKEKTFTYTIKENIPADATDNGDGTYTKDHITYDGHELTVTVTVKQNDDGTITATETYSEDETKTFKNAYDAAGTAQLHAQKDLTGRELGEGEFSFTVTATGNAPTKDKDGKPYASSALTVSNDASGKATFPTFYYTLADMEKNADGSAKDTTYIYTIQEDIPDTKLPGVTYDTTTVTVRVNLHDKGDGTISVTYVTTNDANNTQSNIPGFTFKNAYDAAGHNKVEGTKVLQNRAITADDVWTFTLEPNDGAPMRTLKDGAYVDNEKLETTNNGTASFAFDDLYFVLDDLKDGDSYKDSANFTYTLKESGKVAGVTNDTTTKTVTYTVAQEKVDGELTGNLNVTVSPAKDDLVFTNEYNTKGEITFSGTKTLTNRELKEGEFEFELYDSKGGLIESVKNAAGGSYSFTTIEYTGADLDTDSDGFYKETTKTYTVKEKAGNDANVAYDETEYKITVTLTDDGKGTIETSADPAENTYDFKNEYQAFGKATVSGKKTLEGGTLVKGAFTFKIFEIAKNEAGKYVETLIDTVTNDENGEFKFETLNYEKTDKKDDTKAPHVYKVVEVANKEVSGGVQYSQLVYRVVVTLVDDTQGKLNETIKVVEMKSADVDGTWFDDLDKGENVPMAVDPETGDEAADTSDSVKFVNKALTAKATIKAEKQLEGRPLRDGEFEFQLLDANGEVIDTKANAGTSVTFDEITYEYDWLNENAEYNATDDTWTINYTIKEVVPEGAEQAGDGTMVKDGITYDGSEKSVTVTVYGDRVVDKTADPLVLVSEVEYGNNDNTFTNTYNSKGEATLGATKLYVGEDGKALSLEKGKFSFTATRDDDKVFKASNAADGSVDFGTVLELTQDDFASAKPAEDGSRTITRTFTVQEIVPDGAVSKGKDLYAVGDILYDGAAHEITMTCVDDGKGKITCEPSVLASDLTITNASGEASVVIEAKKVLKDSNGKKVDLKGRTFKFQLLDESGKVIDTKACEADGSVTFDEISYDWEDADTKFTYTIREVKGSDSGVIYDTHTETVTVAVTSDGYALDAEVESKDGELPTFTNKLEKSKGKKKRKHEKEKKKTKKDLAKTGDPFGLTTLYLAGAGSFFTTVGMLRKRRNNRKED